MKRATRQPETLTALFAVGALLFSPIMLGLFDRGADRLFFGLPLLYLYVFIAWAAIIVLLALVAERLPEGPPAASEPGLDNGQEQP